MKIVHIAQHYNDGFGYHENLLPRYQKKYGHEVTIITSKVGSYFKGVPLNRIKNKCCEYEDGGVRIICLPIKREFKGRFVIFDGLDRIIEREKPDYIYHHGITHPSVFEAARYKKKHPSVFLVVDNHSDLNNSGKKYLWKVLYYSIFWKTLLRKIKNYIDLVYGVTPARCYFANEELGIPWDLIRFLPLGADEDLAYEVLKENEIRAQRNRLRIITGGKITKEKNIASLLKALFGLKVNLIIFGAIPVGIKQLIIDYFNKGLKVELYGWQDRKSTLKLLSESDIAIWNRQHTTLIEDAISVMTPLILRYHGSTSHLIRGNGFYLYSDNPLEIRSYIELIIKNKEVLEGMRMHAKEMVNMLSYNRIAKESIDYFYDKAPKESHLFFMNSFLCNPNNDDFKKLPNIN